MSPVLICPKPGCRAENTGRFCNRCGSDVAQIWCPACEHPHPAVVLTSPEARCEGCAAELGSPAFLVAPPGRGSTEPGSLVGGGRFRIVRGFGSGLYLAVDCQPNRKRLAAPPADGSVGAAYRKHSHLAGLPALLDCEPDDAGGGDYLLLGGPLDRSGNLYQALSERWPAASTARRLGWLATWVRLAITLSAEGWSRSVLDPENLRISPEGALCLRALLADEGPVGPAERLAAVWLDLAGPDAGGTAFGALAARLEAGEMGLVEAERELQALRSADRANVRHFGATDTGRKRENNEDSFLGWQAGFNELRPDGASSGVRGLFAVCDGMGGHDRGEVASRTCVQTLRSLVVPILLSEDPGDGDLAGRLGRLVREEVNSAIFARNGGEHDGPFRRMGTTVVMVAVVDDRACWVHVGDSRLYRVTPDRIDQVTEDHNVGTRDVKLGVATMLEAFRSPVGKHLTQALGPRGSEFVHPDSGDLALDEPMVLLLCSDGLADMVPESELKRLLLARWDDPDGAVAELLAQANEGGGLDNITALAIRIEPALPVFGRSGPVAQPAGQSA